MLKIRMQRTGRRNQPSYRVIVIDSRFGPKSGKFIERVGYYNPLVKECVLDKSKIEYWMSKGALLSDTVHNLCITHKVIEGMKKNVLPKHTPIQKAQEEEPVKETEKGKEDEAQADVPKVETEHKEEEQKETAPTEEKTTTEANNAQTQNKEETPPQQTNDTQMQNKEETPPQQTEPPTNEPTETPPPEK